MSHEEDHLDPTIEAELEEALTLLDGHFAKIPQPGLRLFTGIDILRRTRRLAGNAADPLPRRYAMICRNIQAFFFHRRADGIPELLPPEHIEQKLLDLSQRAHALSAEP